MTTIVKDPTQFLKGQFQPQADIIILHKEQVTASGLSAYFYPITQDPEGLRNVPSVKASMFHLLCRTILVKPLIEKTKINFFNGEACAVSVMPYENGTLVDGIKMEFPAGAGPVVMLADAENLERARRYVGPDGFATYENFLTALQAKALSFELAKILGTLPTEDKSPNADLRKNDVDVIVNLVRDKEDRSNRIASISLTNRGLNFGEGGSVSAFFNKAREFLATPVATEMQERMHSGYAERVAAAKAAAAKKAQPEATPA